MGRTTHGMAYSKTYKIWNGILSRCTRPRSTSYENYGGRGIAVCERWQMFPNFLADMGECPPGSSIERIDNNGHYCPENCKWADRIEQGNNRRNNVIIEFNGEKLTAAQWGRKLGIARTTLIRRLRDGKPIERVLSPQILPNGNVGKEPIIAIIRRAMTHCRRGHLLSGGNLYEAVPGKRTCKTCRLETKRKFNAKAKAKRHARGLKRINPRWA